MLLQRARCKANTPFTSACVSPPFEVTDKGSVDWVRVVSIKRCDD
jgi:hypothetical protein